MAAEQPIEALGLYLGTFGACLTLSTVVSNNTLSALVSYYALSPYAL